MEIRWNNSGFVGADFIELETAMKESRVLVVYIYCDELFPGTVDDFKNAFCQYVNARLQNGLTLIPGETVEAYTESTSKSLKNVRSLASEYLVQG